jgi:hypothetical protein
VLREFRWHRSANPFEIVDEDGDVVAQTIRWQNGTDAPRWSETEIFGEGQAVILNLKGFEALRGAGKIGAIRRKVIHRIEPETKLAVDRIVTDLDIGR